MKNPPPIFPLILKLKCLSLQDLEFATHFRTIVMEYGLYRLVDSFFFLYVFEWMKLALKEFGKFLQSWNQLNYISTVSPASLVFKCQIGVGGVNLLKALSLLGGEYTFWKCVYNKHKNWGHSLMNPYGICIPHLWWWVCTSYSIRSCSISTLLFSLIRYNCFFIENTVKRFLISFHFVISNESILFTYTEQYCGYLPRTSLICENRL